MGWRDFFKFKLTTQEEDEHDALDEVADAAHDVLKSFPLESLMPLVPFDGTRETDEYIRDARLRRLHEAFDDYTNVVNGE